MSYDPKYDPSQQGNARFIQLIEVQGLLHALDEEGKVWVYHPASEKSYAGWFKLTEFRKDTSKRNPK